MAHRARLAITPDPRSVGAARRLVDDPELGLSESTDVLAVKLMVSELVSNVIRHTPTGRGEVVLEAEENTVRIEVRDEGAGLPPQVRDPDRQAGGGFGLFLVDRLSDRWGRSGQTCVWFEVDAAAVAHHGETDRFSRATVGSREHDAVR